jgi:SAM-dependent methyltransferase/shikimate kinase
MARVLVTGMSGTGKSTTLVELARRGFRVVDTDSQVWSEWDPEAEDGLGESLWREDRMARLLETHEDGALYVSGCMSNQGKFYDRFDAVVLLSAPAEVILDRLATRTTNDYGKGPGERDRILADLELIEPRLRATCTHEIDASRPLEDVVAALVAIGGDTWLDEHYDAFPRIEEQFAEALDESLDPRGPELLYDLVGGFGLPPGSVALDVGCGEGRHSARLAERFALDVIGVDAVARHIELAQARHGAGARFERGWAERLPVAPDTVDLVWCRDVLLHVADLGRAYSEFRRVLRPGGRVLVYQVFATERLEPREAGFLWRTLRVVPANTDPDHTAAAIAAAGFRLDECIVLGTEWSEWAEEHGPSVGRRLLHASRLLRDRDRYVDRFGTNAYEIMLGDCLWHVYLAIGKLDRRVYLLTHAVS